MGSCPRRFSVRVFLFFLRVSFMQWWVSQNLVPFFARLTRKQYWRTEQNHTNEKVKEWNTRPRTVSQMSFTRKAALQACIRITDNKSRKRNVLVRVTYAYVLFFPNVSSQYLVHPGNCVPLFLFIYLSGVHCKACARHSRIDYPLNTNLSKLRVKLIHRTNKIPPYWGTTPYL